VAQREPHQSSDDVRNSEQNSYLKEYEGPGKILIIKGGGTPRKSVGVRRELGHRGRLKRQRGAKAVTLGVWGVDAEPGIRRSPRKAQEKRLELVSQGGSLSPDRDDPPDLFRPPTTKGRRFQKR